MPDTEPLSSEQLDRILACAPLLPEPGYGVVKQLAATIRLAWKGCEHNADLVLGANALLVERNSQIRSLTSALEAKEQQIAEAQAAIEFDRTSLHRIVQSVDAEIRGRMWLIEGRGSYEWDDDRYRKEFGWACESIGAKLDELRKLSSNLKDSPQTTEAVAAARVDLKAQVERLTSALEAEKRRREGAPHGPDCPCFTTRWRKNRVIDAATKEPRLATPEDCNCWKAEETTK